MSTEFFCTLFDQNYLARGLALYRSLLKVNSNFRLAIYCMDEGSYRLLQKMNLPRVEVVALEVFETPELKSIKPTRSAGEYCWTCTPFIILDSINRFGIKRATYLDADLFFFDDYARAFQSFEEGDRHDVLITEHWYAPQYDQSKTSGRFCVQFVTFRNNENAMRILKHWAAQCLDWCFNRFEDGKFGDQKYLDAWPTSFERIQISQDRGIGVAPWNLSQYTLGLDPSTQKPLVDSTSIVFYHTHAFTLYTSGEVDPCGWYRVPPLTDQLIFFPYTQALKQAYAEIQKVEPGFRKGQKQKPSSMRKFLGYVKHRIQTTVRF